MTANWLGFVDDAGHFALNQRNEFKAWLQKFRGQEVVLTLKKKPKPQSGRSRRYYRGVVIPDIALAMGEHDPDEFEKLHDGFAWKFLRIADGPMGEPRRRSTAQDDMDEQEMSDYITKVIEWSETSIPDCRIRRPNEIDMDTVYDPEWKS